MRVAALHPIKPNIIVILVWFSGQQKVNIFFETPLGLWLIHPREAKEKRKEKKKASQRPRVDDVDSKWMMQVMMKRMPRSQGGGEEGNSEV